MSKAHAEESKAWSDASLANQRSELEKPYYELYDDYYRSSARQMNAEALLRESMAPTAKRQAEFDKTWLGQRMIELERMRSRVLGGNVHFGAGYGRSGGRSKQGDDFGTLTPSPGRRRR